MADAPVPRPAPRRRWWRRVRNGLLALVALYGVAVLLGMPVAAPYDVVMNLGDAPLHPELVVPADGRRRVVVLQHGILRSPLAFLRLQRSLRQHGYELHNFGYDSTGARIEDHAELLRAQIERAAGGRPIDELSFVAHSMGGLVVQEYLRRPGARLPHACIYIATPHRGAVLADLRRHWFPFRWVFGGLAGTQLSPADPFHARPIPTPCPAGTIVGDVGEGNPSIPGHDDGTVGVHEATFAGASASVRVPVGHTAIARAPATIAHVLHFLRHRTFAAAVSGERAPATPASEGLQAAGDAR